MRTRTSTFTAALIILLATSVMAQGRKYPQQKVASLGLFEAIDSSAIVVKAVPQSEKLVIVKLKNQTSAPLAIELPDSIAAVPVLAQQQQPGLNFGAGSPQNLGIGTPGGGPLAGPRNPAQNPGGQGFQGNGQFPFRFNKHALRAPNDVVRSFEFDAYDSAKQFKQPKQPVAAPTSSATTAAKTVRKQLSSTLSRQPFLPDGRVPIKPHSTTTLRLPSVCMEYGDPTPNPSHSFVLVPIIVANTNPQIPVILAQQASGAIDQATAQAAMWHVTNEMSWKRLARLGRFKRSQLIAAKQLFPHESTVSATRQRKPNAPRSSTGNRTHPDASSS